MACSAKKKMTPYNISMTDDDEKKAHVKYCKERICLANCRCCHTELKVADQTCCLTQSQRLDTRPTDPSSDAITPSARSVAHYLGFRYCPSERFIVLVIIVSVYRCFVVCCLRSHLHVSVSQGQLCSESCTCYHAEIEVADQAVSPSHSILTPGQPVLGQTL